MGKVVSVFIFIFFIYINAVEKDRLAVMDAQDKDKIFTQSMRNKITNYIFVKLQGSGKYWMIPKNDRDTALQKAIEDTMRGSREECVDEKCQLSMTAQLQANFLINIEIVRLFKGNCQINIRKFDVEKRAGTDAWEGKFDCGEEGLYEVIDEFNLDGKTQGISKVKTYENADGNACNYAKEKENLKIWQEYLKANPKGACAFEAKMRIDELKLVEKEEKNRNTQKLTKTKDPVYSKNFKIVWYEKAQKSVYWEEAKIYCENLKEDNFFNWRLPTISELKTIVRNCPSIQNKEICKISENCLHSNCLTSCSCSFDSSGIYSIFSDTDRFWSSSELPNNKHRVWSINFNNAGIVDVYKMEKNSVRCVRSK